MVKIYNTNAYLIYNLNTGIRSNRAKNIIIGNHVWVTAHAIIQKGCLIGNGCIIGTHAIVNSRSCIMNDTQNPATNAVIAGIPATIVKTDIVWKRKFDN